MVLFRAEDNRRAGVEGALAYARAIGMRVVYDIDDLVLDPDLADSLNGVRRVNRVDRRSCVDSMAQWRRLLLTADLVAVSTVYLTRWLKAGAAECGDPNINCEHERVAAEIAAAGPQPHDGVRKAFSFGPPWSNGQTEGQITKLTLVKTANAGGGRRRPAV